MENKENFDYGVFNTPEFKALENYIIQTYNLFTNKLAEGKVFSPNNPDYLYYQWLDYKGIRTGLKIWLNLIMFIRLFQKRKRFNKEFISVIQGVLNGLKLPLNWLYHRRQEKNRQSSEATKVEQVNTMDPNLLAEKLLSANREAVKITDKLKPTKKRTSQQKR